MSACGAAHVLCLQVGDSPPRRYATLVADVDRMLRSTIVELSSFSDCDGVVAEARATFTGAFHWLHPTWRLKLMCLNRLLNVVCAGGATEGTANLLATVLNALSTTSGVAEMFFADASVSASEGEGSPLGSPSGDEGAEPVKKKNTVAAPSSLALAAESTLLQMYASESEMKVSGEVGDATMGLQPLLYLLSLGLNRTLKDVVSDAGVVASRPAYMEAAVRLLVVIQGELVAAIGEIDVAVAGGKPYGLMQTCVRLTQHQGVGWGYGGSPDAVSFTVDQDVYIAGIGLYGGSGPADADVKLVEGRSSQQDQVGIATVHVDYDTRTEEPFQALFESPVLVSAGSQYTLIATIRCPTNTHSGNRPEGSLVPTDAGVSFQFMNIDGGPNNGTGDTSGQIPAVYFCMPSKGGKGAAGGAKKAGAVAAMPGAAAEKKLSKAERKKLKKNKKKPVAAAAGAKVAAAAATESPEELVAAAAVVAASRAQREQRAAHFLKFAGIILTRAEEVGSARIGAVVLWCDVRVCCRCLIEFWTQMQRLRGWILLAHCLYLGGLTVG